MATQDTHPAKPPVHCAYCGHPVDGDASPTERFGERFCSEAHAEQFTEGVRTARIEAVARQEAGGAACGVPAAGAQALSARLKRAACWGAPVLLLLAIPLFWTGNALAVAGGSVLTVAAALACPIGMYLMMRMMMHGGQHDSQHRVPPTTAGGRREETRDA